MASTDHSRRIAARAMDARAEVARHDLCWAQARLCSPRIRGRRRIYVEIVAQYNGVTIEIRGPELDAFDVGVLLAVYAIAAQDVSDRASCEERGMLAVDPAHAGQPNAAACMDSLRVQTTIAAIAEKVGRDSRDGDARKRIRQSISRLMSFTVAGTNGDTWGATHLIQRAGDTHGEITIDLDYRASLAVMGEGQWAAVSMRQWRECSSPLERVLLHRIAVLTTGRPVTVGLDVLARGCWADEARDDHDRRWRRQQVRDALAAGRALPSGITAETDARGVVTFRRSLNHAA